MIFQAIHIIVLLGKKFQKFSFFIIYDLGCV